MILHNCGVMKIDVLNCARCDGVHLQIEVEPFRGVANPVYSHWCLCPESKQPILVRFETVGEPE